MKLRRSPFADLEARARTRAAAREGGVERAAAAVREARDAYDRDPSPAAHRRLAEAVGALAVASDPGRETGTARLWARRFGLPG